MEWEMEETLKLFNGNKNGDIGGLGEQFVY